MRRGTTNGRYYELNRCLSRGCRYLPAERLHEFGKVGERVVGTRSGLGMVLHGEEWKLAMPNSLYGPVIQVQVGHLQRGRAGNPGSLSNHREAMVLGGDENLIGPQSRTG